MKLSGPSPAAVLFVPTNLFFLRVVPIAPDAPPVQQAELALEGFAPFPPAQLYWGCTVSPDRTRALVYAAHRRRFPAEATQAWGRSELVVPDALPLLARQGSGNEVVLHQSGNQLSGAAWRAGEHWPAELQSRGFEAEPDEAARQLFAAKLAARAGIGGAAVRVANGAPRARREKDALLVDLGTGGAALTVPRGDIDGLDIRDRAFLARQRQERRRGEWIWRGLMTAATVLALALLLDLSAAGLRLMLNAERAEIAERAPVVQRLETLHALTSRVDDLSTRRLRFFEMLAAINPVRPPSIQFTRTGSKGRNAIEIDAQTNSQIDVSTYESALRGIAGLEKVEVRQLLTKQDGVTTFTLDVTFKADASLQPPSSGGAP